MTKVCNSFILEVNDEGVFLGSSENNTSCQVMDKDGRLTPYGANRSTHVQSAAREALEEWKQRFPHKSHEPLYPGWGYVVGHDGNGYAESSGHTKVYLERSYNSNHNINELRVRIDNNQKSDTKSAPLEVILRLVGKEMQRLLKLPE